MEPLNTSSVAIDGLAVRKIREEKRLTQFYVSKVVGVTTDTVSRWENNRYPTIMRDNALKLAEALEVELDDILKKEPETEGLETTEPLTSRKNKIWFPLLIAVIIIAVAAGYFTLQPAPAPAVVLHAKRLLPSYAAPGSQVLIRVELSADKSLKGMILKETFPTGWQLLEAQPVVSHLDSETGKARWIFRKPPLVTHVFYLLTVPESARVGEDFTIHGELIANPDGQHFVTPVESVGTMKIEPFHWADTNGDGIIDDLEILEISDLTDEAEPLDLGWDLIEAIWETGAYQWQADQKQFVPVEPPLDQ
jgi:transcriptional regulator with XRE-family HTH domain